MYFPWETLRNIALIEFNAIIGLIYNVKLTKTNLDSDQFMDSTEVLPILKGAWVLFLDWDLSILYKVGLKCLFFCGQDNLLGGQFGVMGRFNLLGGQNN